MFTQMMVEQHKYFNIQECTEDFFKTKYEKHFWEQNKKNHFNCIQDPDLMMHGTHDQSTLMLNSTYFVVEVMKCTEETRNKTRLAPDDPLCTKDDCQVDPKCDDDNGPWLKDKNIAIRTINNKIDFDQYNEKFLLRQQ